MQTTRFTIITRALNGGLGTPRGGEKKNEGQAL